MEVVAEVLRRLEMKGAQVNPEKSFWARPEVEYLGFVIPQNGIKPLNNKIQELLDVKEPKSSKQVQSFVRVINYNKSLWPRRSKVLSPLTALTGKRVPFF